MHTEVQICVVKLFALLQTSKAMCIFAISQAVLFAAERSVATCNRSAGISLGVQ